MDNAFDRELWVKAQENAKEKYEEECGWLSWDEADKYTREDWVFAEYERLLNEKENNMAQLRDARGRFCKALSEISNNKTTNTNLNKKGNDTMMNNKMTKAEERMNKLTEAGYNTDNFFNLSMQIPFGAEVVIKVDGKEMVIPATNSGITATAYGNHVVGNGLVGNFVGIPTILSSNGDICNAETGEVLVMANDPIAQNIINDGYVKNSHLFRRWITAKTISMLEYVDRRNAYRKGWEACMKDCYAYGYQFEQMADELHTLAKLQKEDPEYFAERTKFFNGDVTVALLEDYLYRLKKYVKKQLRTNPKKYRGEAYVKLARYGNVLVKDLNTKVYVPIRNGITDVRYAMASGDYSKIEKIFRDFMSKLYNKLPYETTKSSVWKDAFKGAGAYYSLQNLIRFHNVILKGCNHKYDSELKLKELLNGEYKNEVWRFHKLLVGTLEYNKFDLKQSIANGHAAKNTTSTRANIYRK